MEHIPVFSASEGCRKRNWGHSLLAAACRKRTRQRAALVDTESLFAAACRKRT